MVMMTVVMVQMKQIVQQIHQDLHVVIVNFLVILVISVFLRVSTVIMNVIAWTEVMKLVAVSTQVFYLELSAIKRKFKIF